MRREGRTVSRPLCLNSGPDFPICQLVLKAQCRVRAEGDEAPVRASLYVPTRMRGADRKGLSGRMSRMTLLDGNLWLSLAGKRVDASARAEGGYPPYNIELLPEDGGGAEMLRITLAVAGFARDELDVTVEDGELLIRGARHEDGSKDYLHHGIAARQFKRSFALAKGVEVRKAELHNGLLAIELERPHRERGVLKVGITPSS